MSNRMCQGGPLTRLWRTEHPVSQQGFSRERHPHWDMDRSGGQSGKEVCGVFQARGSSTYKGLESRQSTNERSLCAKLLQSCPTLCNSMDYSPPGSSVPGIPQARILQWVAMASSRGSSWSMVQTRVSYISCIDECVLYHWHHLGCPQRSLTPT